MRRRRFLQGMATLAVSAPLLNAMACAGPVDHTTLGAGHLRELLSSGSLRSEDLVKACLAKIARLDPRLHSVIEVNPEAMSIAAQWDRSGSRDSLLGGLPVLLKDNIATADLMTTSAGSAALADSRYPTDSGVAKRLREAGAVLLGKTNMSEWANYRSTNSSSGWSARGGQCRNPYALDRSPCGSSSGSAVAVSAELCPLAVGTETVGSVVCPSGISGIVGFKPTAGVVPGDGVIPIAPSWETAGSMARTVEDAALLHSVLAGASNVALRPDALKGARIGVGREFFGFDARVDGIMEREIARLRELGARIVDPVKVPGWDSFGAAAQTVMRFEFKAALNEYLQGQNSQAKVRSLQQVIEFNESHSQLEAMDTLGQASLLAAQACGDLKEPSYLQALAKVKSLAWDAMDRFFAEQGLNAVVAPTNGPAWLIDFINGDHFEGGCAAPAAVAGCPHLTLPAGFIRGLPVGLSFFGPRHKDLEVLELGIHYESASLHRRSPTFPGTVG